MGQAASADPRRLAKRSVQTLREGGMRALWWQVLATAGLRRLEIHCRPVQREPAPPVAGVAIRALTPADVDRYLELDPDPQISRAEFLRRLRAGDRCLGAWRGDDLVGSRWLATEEARVSYLGVTFSIAPNACYFYEAFTAPSQRRRGIGNLLDAAARAEARSLGKANVLSGLLPENRIGVDFLRTWSRRLGVVTSLRLGPWRVCRSSVPSAYIGRVNGLPRRSVR